jgi:hypothetical protein
MRSTTDHVTAVMVPVAATASQNATAAQEASLSTRQLAIGIAEIDSTARDLRDQAEQLEKLVGKFIIDDSRRSFSAPSLAPLLLLARVTREFNDQRVGEMRSERVRAFADAVA